MLTRARGLEIVKRIGDELLGVRGALFILVVVLLAGCTKPTDTQSSVPPNAEYVTASGSHRGLCAQLLLSAGAEEQVLGRDVPLSINLTNCGTLPIEIAGGGRCGGGPEIRIENYPDTYVLSNTDGPGRPINESSFAGTFGPCPLVDHTRDLKPHETRQFNYSWNGTLVDQSCSTNATATGTSIQCREVARVAMPGEYTIHAFLAASDGYSRYEWTTTQRLQWHSSSATCVRCPIAS